MIIKLARIRILHTKNKTKEKATITYKYSNLKRCTGKTAYIRCFRIATSRLSSRWFLLRTTMALLSISAAFARVMRSTSRAHESSSLVSRICSFDQQRMVRRLAWGGWPQKGEQIRILVGFDLFFFCYGSYFSLIYKFSSS